ncbi:RNA-DNA hybrid ribonuclease [Linnemannia zychae]|nr:RNA-DNA hybrid ribonuclease [Linnemannia zychae]
MHPSSHTPTLRPRPLHDSPSSTSSLLTPAGSPQNCGDTSGSPSLTPPPPIALTRKRPLLEEGALKKRIRPDDLARRFQAVEMRGEVKDVPVQEDDHGFPYVLVEDILEAFSVYGEDFHLDGKPVPYLQDHHRKRYSPRRIAYYPGQLLTMSPAQTNNPVPSPANTPSRSVSPVTEEVLISMFDRVHQDQDMNTVILKAEVHSVQVKLSQMEDALLASNAKNAELLQQTLDLQNKLNVLVTRLSEVQTLTLDHLMALQQQVQAVFTQSYELHEYTSPRLFIVLPEVDYQGFNPLSALESRTCHKFRLYFLCECGLHTHPTGPNQANYVHIARHEGYEITRPTEFFRKYGPRTLQMLRILKGGLTIAGMVIPALHTIAAVDLPGGVVKDLDLRVTDSIRYLDQYYNRLDKNVSGMDNGGVLTNKINMEQIAAMDGSNTAIDALFQESFIQMEGADLRRLGSFLKRKDQDGTYGNLFRTVDAQGHVRWICLDHYHATYRQRQDREFENEIKLNRGVYDKHLGTVKITLTSGEAFDRFMGAMTRASAFNELDIHLRNYSYQELKMLAESLKKTNVSKLTLTCHDYREIASMGKKKFLGILRMMNTGKVRYFHFRDIKDLIPNRGLTIPKELPFVRSLELMEISLKDGHELLGDLLGVCTNLSILRLTDISLKSNRLVSVLKGLLSCRRLTILSLRNCDILEAHSTVLASHLRKYLSLKELDLGHNYLDDAGCCAVIEAVGDRLEKLALPSSGFGNDSAMALDRVVSGKHLRSLDISESKNELDLEAMERIIHLVSRLSCTELILPRTAWPSDEPCSRMVCAIDTSKLEHLELQNGGCGDLTAGALANLFSQPEGRCSVLSSFEVDLRRATFEGAQVVARSLRDCSHAKVSFNGSLLFNTSISNPIYLQKVLTDLCSHLSILHLKDTCMDDYVAAVLCKALEDIGPLSRLQSLDLSDNKMTAQGGSALLDCLAYHSTLRSLRLESPSFIQPGSMGPAIQRFLEVNRLLARLSVSHVNLRELTLGLTRNANKLLSIEAHLVDGEADDILAFCDFLRSSHFNTLLRLVIKRARVCDSEPSLEHLVQCLKQNQTLLDLEWEFDKGYDVVGTAATDSHHDLQRYIDRNRDLWRKNTTAGAAAVKVEDLALLGIDPWTMRVIGRNVEH